MTRKICKPSKLQKFGSKIKTVTREMQKISSVVLNINRINASSLNLSNGDLIPLMKPLNNALMYFTKPPDMKQIIVMNKILSMVVERKVRKDKILMVIKQDSKNKSDVILTLGIQYKCSCQFS